MTDQIINIRIDAELKKAFIECARSKDLTASQMLRNYMRYEVEKSAESNKQDKTLQSVKGRKNARKNR